MVEINSYNNGQGAITKRSGVLMTAGWICAILSLFIYPFIFGVIAVICGILATKRGGKAGLTLIVASIILMGVGLLYSGVILNNARHYLGF